MAEYSVLEEQVKRGLIAKRAEENLRFASQPEYQEMVRTTLRTAAQKMLGYETSESTVELDSLIDASDFLKTQMYDSATKAYLTREEFDSAMRNSFEDMSAQMPLQEKTKQRIAQVNELVYESIDLIQQYVSEVVTIAQQDGLVYALSNEGEAQATRLVFRTREEYTKVSGQQFSIVGEYLNQLASAFEDDGSEGASIMGGMLRSLLGSLESVTETFGEIYLALIEEKADRIYGMN